MLNSIEAIKRDALLNALLRNRNNRTRAAQELGISLRTCRNWIKKYKLSKAFPPLKTETQMEMFSKKKTQNKAEQKHWIGR